MFKTPSRGFRASQPLQNKKLLYSTLGVEDDATQQEIKRAYLMLARKYHPDVNKQKDAEKKFSEINEAYETLGDE